jgi:hypothetical protein
MGIELVTVLGKRTGMNCYDCGFSKPSLILLLSGQEVSAAICDCPWTISRVCTCSPAVVGDGVAAVVSIWGITTA